MKRFWILLCAALLAVAIGSTIPVVAQSLNLNYGTSTTTTCPTGTSAYAACTFTVTLVNTEPDTNYAVVCSGITFSGYPHIAGLSKGGVNNNVITVTVENGSSSAAVASGYAEMDCIAAGT